MYLVPTLVCLLTWTVLTEAQAKKTLTDNILVDTRAAFDGCLKASPTYTLTKWTASQLLTPPNSTVFKEELSDPTSARYCKNNFSIYSIYYKDDPKFRYTTGVCSLSAEPQDSFFQKIGRLPNVAREQIGTFVLAPGQFSQGFSSKDLVGNNDFWFAGDVQTIDAVWAFASSYVSANLVQAQWIAAVTNDSCVVDAASAASVTAGDYWDSAVSAAVMATYIVLVGPWPASVGCLRNQLEVIIGTTSWAFFGDDFSPVAGHGLCYNTLPAGSLPQGQRPSAQSTRAIPSSSAVSKIYPSTLLSTSKGTPTSKAVPPGSVSASLSTSIAISITSTTSNKPSTSTAPTLKSSTATSKALTSTSSSSLFVLSPTFTTLSSLSLSTSSLQIPTISTLSFTTISAPIIILATPGSSSSLVYPQSTSVFMTTIRSTATRYSTIIKSSIPQTPTFTTLETSSTIIPIPSIIGASVLTPSFIIISQSTLYPSFTTLQPPTTIILTPSAVQVLPISSSFTTISQSTLYTSFTTLQLPTTVILTPSMIQVSASSPSFTDLEPTISIILTPSTIQVSTVTPSFTAISQSTLYPPFTTLQTTIPIILAPTTIRTSDLTPSFTSISQSTLYPSTTTLQSTTASMLTPSTPQASTLTPSFTTLKSTISVIPIPSTIQASTLTPIFTTYPHPLTPLFTTIIIPDITLEPEPEPEATTTIILAVTLPDDAFDTSAPAPIPTSMPSSTSLPPPVQTILQVKPIVGSHTYLGCFTEGNATRALKDFFVSDYKGMTLEMCESSCAGYVFWGVEYGGECWCGNTKDVTSILATSQRECNFLCPGDQYEYCGAGNRLEMYKLTSAL